MLLADEFFIRLCSCAAGSSTGADGGNWIPALTAQKRIPNALHFC
jgi:hypothetical protein